VAEARSPIDPLGRLMLEFDGHELPMANRLAKAPAAGVTLLRYRNCASPVLPARLSLLVGTKNEAWHLLTAGAFVTIVVPLLVFVGLQRYFVRGLVTGSVKG